MKRISALLLALCMILSCTSALAGDSFNREGFPICDEPITITLAGMSSTAAAGNFQDTYVVKAIAEKMGIQLECTHYMGDVWNSKLNLMLATDTLPDLIVAANVGRNNAHLWGDQGYFLNIADYLDYMPNYKAFREANPDMAAYETTESGAIYALTSHKQSDLACVNDMTWINTRWLKNVGKEMPTTVEELYDVLKAFKEQDANGNGDPTDEIPLSFNTGAGQRMLWILRAAFGIYSTATDYVLQADEAGTVYLAETTESYKAYITFMRKLYAEGLVDNTCFIQTNDELNQKIASDRVGIFCHWNGSMYSTLGRSGPEVWDEWDFFPGIKSEYVDEIKFPIFTATTSGAWTMINANTKHPEAICRLLDYQYSEEGYVFFNYGEEGKTFNWAEDVLGNKYPSCAGFYNPEEMNETNYLYTVRISNGFNNFQVFHTNNSVENATAEELELIIADASDGTLTTRAVTERCLRNYPLMIPFPNLTYTAEESEEMGNLSPDMTNFIATCRTSFITGTMDIDKEWDSFISTLEGMGLEKMLEFNQAAYSRQQH